jgi:hypothetical protein
MERWSIGGKKGSRGRGFEVSRGQGEMIKDWSVGVLEYWRKEGVKGE